MAKDRVTVSFTVEYDPEREGDIREYAEENNNISDRSLPLAEVVAGLVEGETRSNIEYDSNSHGINVVDVTRTVTQ